MGSFVGCLNPDVDYKEIEDGVYAVKSVVKDLTAKGCRIEIGHEHRYWEYGSAVELFFQHMESNTSAKILNVGSGFDGLSPTLATFPTVRITDCEPDETSRNARIKVNEILALDKCESINILPNGLENLPDETYDLVYCISVLEHTSNEEQCWKNLADCVKPGGVLFITTDVIPDPTRSYHFDNLRATNYTVTKLQARVEMIRSLGFNTIGKPDYNYYGDHVFGYSFFRAGLIRSGLRR